MKDKWCMLCDNVLFSSRYGATTLMCCVQLCCAISFTLLVHILMHSYF